MPRARKARFQVGTTARYSSIRSHCYGTGGPGSAVCAHNPRGQRRPDIRTRNRSRRSLDRAKSFGETSDDVWRSRSMPSHKNRTDVVSLCREVDPGPGLLLDMSPARTRFRRTRTDAVGCSGRLDGLITRRSEVQILPPPPCDVARHRRPRCVKTSQTTVSPGQPIGR